MRRVWQSLYLWGLKPLRHVGPEGRAWAARAARGSKRARLVWWALVLVVGSGLFAALAAAGAWIVHWRLWEYHPDSFETVLDDLGDDEYLWSYVTAWAIAAGITLVALVAMRLIWLRIGAKRALLRRDKCAACGHGLSGVPIGEADLVTCPECAVGTRAVEAWNEIDRQGGERAVFAPARGLLKQFWTRRRLIQSAKLSAAIALLCLLGYGGWWTVREVGIRREAKIARAERAGSQSINAMIRKGIPDRVGSKPLVSELVKQLADTARALESDYRTQKLADVPNADSLIVAPDGFPRRLSGDESETDLLGIHHSRLLVAQMREAGLFEVIDRIPDADPWSMPTYVAIDEDPSQIGGTGDLRRVFRTCIARMRLAREVGEVDEYRRAMRSAVALTNFASSGPHLIDWLVAAACEGMVVAEANYLLQQPRNEAWLDVVEEETARTNRRPVSLAFEIEEQYVLDTLAWYFSDVSRVRKGLSAPELEDKLGIGGAIDFRRFFGGDADDAPNRLGTYTENRDAAKLVFERLRTLSRTEIWQRASISRTSEPAPDLVILYQYMSPMEQVLKAADRGELYRRALRTMISLERHRLAHGAYPNSLADLSPSSPGTAVVDPYSGKPFGYRLTDPARDAFNRGYLLWTVGWDGIDNGGNAEEKTWDTPLRRAGAGKDLILNDPRW